MSLAPSIAVPRAGFNWLPLTITLFCLLWSFAFVAGKIGVTDCPPLILLTARFSLAGVLILGISAIRSEGWQLSWRDVAVFAVLGVANNALYLGLGYTGLKTVSAGLGGLIVSANPVFTAVRGRGVSRRGADLAQGDGTVARHRRRRLHRLAPHVGRDRQRGWHRLHAGVARLDRGRHHPVQGAGAEGQPVGRQRRAESRRRPGAAAVRLHAFQRQRHRAECAAARRVRLPGAGRIDPGLSAVVSPAEGLRRDGCQRLSLPDAAARHAVRLPRARRARRIPRPARDHSGGARHLSGDAARCGSSFGSDARNVRL